MKKILLLSLVFLLVCFGLVATASADGVDVKLECPTSVSYGTGNTILWVTAYLKNWNCTDSVTVKRHITAIVANSANTLAGAGLYGPLHKWLSSPITVVPANCSTCSNPDGCPGTANVNLPVMYVPNVTGKMAMALVDFLTNTGEDIGGGTCLVSITP